MWTMKRRNNQTNRLIKWVVDIGDFLTLNVIILLFSHFHWRMVAWGHEMVEIFFLVNNLALILSLIQFSTIIHLRKINVVDILRQILGLILMHTVLAYLLMKALTYQYPVGRLQMEIGIVFVVLLILKCLIERYFIKIYREAGGNTRYVVLAGSDTEVANVYRKLQDDPTLGYKVLGYYGDDIEDDGLYRIGSMADFVGHLDHPEELILGDELYLCVSRKEQILVRKVSQLCDHRVIRFYYIPILEESFGMNMKREMLDDIEIFTTYENPLQNSVNRTIKRASDIVFSLLFMIPTILILPFVWLIIKIQSPGPLFFRQERTGLDGKTFLCIKFRSMYVNDQADTLQTTKDDPRKFPFGSFMRQMNIDELPQFWNVLKGDMSIVGPRPHMLAHTEIYSQLIDKYMVRHFMKPGITGWAQVTGYRGETKELWQMEERVRRDIWYMEHWSIWLDIRIIWMTIKTMFMHDINAY